MQAKLAQSDAELERIAPVLVQLRFHFDTQSLLERIKVQREDGYQVAFVESDDGEVLCVAGFVISYKLAWGKNLYVDDLVTDESRRSTGAGSCMIDFLKAYAREHGCEQLHLDSGVTRFRAHKFYLREGFRISSHHLAILDLDAEQ
ncbi:MAG: GNAT family N-acetyltransferase [Gammaproteobacteria bacterium]|nr:GNAT family N-acetyltransferase [Gammaproteobacteria bacterium]